MVAGGSLRTRPPPHTHTHTHTNLRVVRYVSLFAQCVLEFASTHQSDWEMRKMKTVDIATTSWELRRVLITRREFYELLI